MSKANKKKRKLHRCKNHPQRNARGKCSVCGEWVCSDCAVLQKGQFYCADTCFPAKESALEIPRHVEQPVQINEISNKDNNTKTPFLVILWAITTLILSVLIIVQINSNNNLKKRIHLLEKRQHELIRILKKQQKQKVKKEIEKKAEQKKIEPAKKNTHSRKKIKSPYNLPLDFTNGSRSKKLVSLTFDGGSHINATSEILDTLKSRNVKATIFVTGKFIEHYPDIVQRFVNEGHEVGNHTYRHPHLTSYEKTRTQTTLPKINAQFLRNQLDKANQIMKDKTGVELVPLWRAPFGDINSQISLWGQDAGYFHVGWGQGRTWKLNLDSNDWVPNPQTPGYHSPQEVYDKIMTLAKREPYGINGGIILMHLGTDRKEHDQQVHHIIGRIIDDLREMGYEFVPVTKLLKESNIDISLLSRTQVQ